MVLVDLGRPRINQARVLGQAIEHPRGDFVRLGGVPLVAQVVLGPVATKGQAILGKAVLSHSKRRVIHQ